MTTTPERLLALLLTMLVLLAACSGDSDDDSGDSAAVEPVSGGDAGDAATAVTVPPAEDAGEVAAAGDAAVDEGEVDRGPGAPGVVPAAVSVADFGRDIVFTADIELEVADVAVASQRATAEIGALGGIVFGQDATNDPTPRAVFTYKIAPERFQAALAALAELGVPRSQTVSADDVTERVVDLQSRIQTSEASVDRLRALLEQAGDLDTIAGLEGQLLERETVLEQLRGQLRTLQDQVALATIVAVFTEEAPAPALSLTHTGYEGTLEDDACPGSDELAVDEGDGLVLCATVVNSGDTMLSGLAFTDDALDVDAADVTVVEGDLDDPLAPGERIIVAYPVTAEPGVSSALRVTAEPTDAEGNPIREAIRADGERVELDVRASDALPGFGDALQGGLDVLRTAVGVIVVVAGAIVPFVWLVPVAWLVARLLQRRRSSPLIDQQAAEQPA